MYDIAMLVLAAIAAIGAVLAVLPLLGVDIRIFGRQTVPVAPTDSTRTRKAWLALILALLSLGLSAGAFSYFFRPRVVDKIIEKQIPQPCPEQKEPAATPVPRAKTPKSNGPMLANPITTPKVAQSQPQTVINADRGIGIAGGTVNNPTVNNYQHATPTIDDQQGNAIAASLAPFRGQKIDIDIVQPSAESVKFANALIASLEKAGIVVNRNDIGALVGGCVRYPDITFMVGVNRMQFASEVWRSLISAKVVTERPDHTIPGCSRSGEPDEFHLQIFPE